MFPGCHFRRFWLYSLPQWSQWWRTLSLSRRTNPGWVIVSSKKRLFKDAQNINWINRMYFKGKLLLFYLGLRCFEQTSSNWSCLSSPSFLPLLIGIRDLECIYLFALEHTCTLCTYCLSLCVCAVQFWYVKLLFYLEIFGFNLFLFFPRQY